MGRARIPENCHKPKRSKMQLVDMGNIGFSLDGNIGTYGCGPCLGILLELNNLYACAHLHRVEQVGSFMIMVDRLKSLGYQIKRTITFQEERNSERLQALHTALGPTEFFHSHQAGFCNGELVTKFAIPRADLLQLELTSLRCLTSQPAFLQVQFRPPGLEVYNAGNRSLFYDAQGFCNLENLPETAPLKPPVISNSRKAFIKASRIKFK